jgi:hypothetical protein
MTTARRFPPPWSAEVQPNYYVVRDANKQQLAYIYYESEPGRRSAAKMLSKDEARRIAANIANCPSYCGNPDATCGNIRDGGGFYWLGRPYSVAPVAPDAPTPVAPCPGPQGAVRLSQIWTVPLVAANIAKLPELLRK